ncbi:MAG: integrase/recombinase XerD [Parvicella sp.]|jgi:integrase/recombinase XerD
MKALLKQLPEIKWNSEFQMVYMPNRKKNLQRVYEAFRGVAHLNGKQFLVMAVVNYRHEEL